MNSSDHPVVQRGIKAAELISNVSFRCYRDFAQYFAVTFFLFSAPFSFFFEAAKIKNNILNAEKLQRRLGS